MRIIITAVGADRSLASRSLLVEIIRPADGATIFRREASLSKTADPLEVVWDTDAESPTGLYQVSVRFSHEKLHTLCAVVVTSAAAEAEAESVAQALDHLGAARDHRSKKDFPAAAAALASAAAAFSRGHAHESALACWRKTVVAQLELTMYEEARVSLRNALSDLFEAVQMRMKHSPNRELGDVNQPFRLAVHYPDVEGLYGLAAQAASETQFDSDIQKAIKAQRDEALPSARLDQQGIYSLFELCEDLQLSGGYYERLLRRYYDEPFFKDVCWVGLERCHPHFADDALKQETKRAVRNPQEEGYGKFLCGSYAISGKVQPFLRSAMSSPLPLGEHIFRTLSEGTSLECSGGNSENFRITDPARDKTLTEVRFSDKTARILGPMLQKRLRGAKPRLERQLAR